MNAAAALGTTAPAPDEAAVQEERRRAVRLLLAHPFLTDDGRGDGLVLVRRHAAWLRSWFLDHLGYRLVVDPELARLHKRPAPGARPRPAHTRSGTPFDPRRYALLCLLLAALERLEVQTVLSELAEQVQLLAASESGVADLDLESVGERQAFVDAVRLLVEHGVLNLTDGDDTAFVERRGDALYDIHPRRLGQMLAAPVAPSRVADLAAGGWRRLAAESYPDTDEGANRRRRHRLTRRLLEEPALYLQDLPDDELAYLASQRPALVARARDAAGLEVEVRREGLVALDPRGELTDLAFPSVGTLSHATLLLADELARRGRGGDALVPYGELRATLETAAERHDGRWSRHYTEGPEALDRLLEDALDRLQALDLARRRDAGVEPRPAVARYAAAEPEEKGETDAEGTDAEDDHA